MNRKQRENREKIANLRYHARTVVEIFEYILIVILIYVHFIKGERSDLLINTFFIVSIIKLIFGLIDLKERHADKLENILKLVADIIIPIVVIAMITFGLYLK